MTNKYVAYTAVILYSLLIIVPLFLALDRLIWVAGFDILGWLGSLDENFISQGVLEFTINSSHAIRNSNISTRNSNRLATWKI